MFYSSRQREQKKKHIFEDDVWAAFFSDKWHTFISVTVDGRLSVDQHIHTLWDVQTKRDTLPLPHRTPCWNDILQTTRYVLNADCSVWGIYRPYHVKPASSFTWLIPVSIYCIISLSTTTTTKSFVPQGSRNHFPTLQEFLWNVPVSIQLI